MEHADAPEAKWLRLTEESNALDYLTRAAQFIREAEANVAAWKWAILALHGSLYGFAVSAAKGTDYQRVTGDNGKLLNFWKVLELCQDPDYMKMTIHSRHLELSNEQREAIELMTKLLRNRLEHYVPTTWSIEIHGLPMMAAHVLEVIRFLALDTRTYVHLSRKDEEVVYSTVEDMIRYLQSTDLWREAEEALHLYKSKPT